MKRENIEAALASAVDSMRAEGDSWWPGIEISPIAYRRMSTFSRRHRSSKQPTDDHRVSDLVKGLQAHFEPGTPYTHIDDWRSLAGVLFAVFVDLTDP